MYGIGTMVLRFTAIQNLDLLWRNLKKITVILKYRHESACLYYIKRNKRMFLKYNSVRTWFVITPLVSSILKN
jgi:hypothetical protein